MNKKREKRNKQLEIEKKAEYAAISVPHLFLVLIPFETGCFDVWLSMTGSEDNPQSRYLIIPRHSLSLTFFFRIETFKFILSYFFVSTTVCSYDAGGTLQIDIQCVL